MKSIAQIREELESSVNDRETLLAFYEKDSRKGVQTLVAKYRKKAEWLANERMRLQKMREFENKYCQFQAICGVDEAGRGPLAGPVVAGAVILPVDTEILYLNDSKKISASRREELFEEIKEKAVSWALGIASPERIDEINILQATYEAMQQAVTALMPAPDLLLVDAVTIPGVAQKQVGIIKGDARSVSIAAASIVAKVTRDHMMMEMDAQYPEYGFSSHKGYGSPAHIEAIKKYGPSPIHRRTFIKKFVS
ncbi:MAG: ribonuclease HII [Lachnospiraceae bacterium]|nr:ribonuclease HII [Lachnospiraceae bacterium]